MKSETINNEAQVCYQGFFWVIAKSFEDILNGNYKILAEKFVAENGKELNKNSRTHKRVWDGKYKKEYGVAYNYYPRGRITVKNSSYRLYLPPEIYQPDIIDNLTDEFKVGKLKRNTSIKESSKGAPYAFLLK